MGINAEERSLSLEPREGEMENGNCLGALSLLPVEMWEAVLERVDDSKDVRHFCKAWKYPNWDLILHRTKASWLFDEIFPLLFPYLSSKQQVLFCRLVCKRWCKAVDQFLENNPCRRPSHHNNSSDMVRLGPLAKSLRDKALLHASFSSGKINNIMQHYSEIPATSSINFSKNPIVGRSAYFDWSMDTPASQILPFLSKVGHHIWDFRIEIHEDTPLQLFQCLQKYLKQLPNLKRLEIFGETTLVIEKTVEKNLQELNTHINSGSSLLPQLTQLETLDATVFNQYRETILELLLTAYSAQLRSLNIYCYVIPLKSCIKLENLTDLTLSLDSDKQLDRIIEFKMPLVRRLTIYILRNSSNGSYPNFSNIFQMINRACFSKTLFALSVEFPVTYSPIQWSQQSTLPTLTLPHLKTLELKEATLYSLNCIAQITTLEYLHISKCRSNQRVGMEHHYAAENEVKEQEILDLNQILDNPSINSESVYKSNLWKVLPRLKIFTFSRSTNSRAPAMRELCYRRRH